VPQPHQLRLELPRLLGLDALELPLLRQFELPPSGGCPSPGQRPEYCDRADGKLGPSLQEGKLSVGGESTFSESSFVPPLIAIIDDPCDRVDRLYRPGNHAPRDHIALPKTHEGCAAGRERQSHRQPEPSSP
jgi:hypothetical protein